MRIWLRSIFDAVLGKVPGKTSRPDTATRMAMDDADFTRRPAARSIRSAPQNAAMAALATQNIDAGRAPSTVVFPIGTSF